MLPVLSSLGRGKKRDTGNGAGREVSSTDMNTRAPNEKIGVNISEILDSVGSRRARLATWLREIDLKFQITYSVTTS